MSPLFRVVWRAIIRLPLTVASSPRNGACSVAASGAVSSATPAWWPGADALVASAPGEVFGRSPKNMGLVFRV